MATYKASDLRITKTGEDSYHVVLKEDHIDEAVNGAQLLGMFEEESFTDSKVNLVSAQGILTRFDTLEIGREIVVTRTRRVA
jgi:hypothetical protein